MDTGLVEALKAQQRELKLTDAQMARRLRVSRPLWTRVRLGKYDSLPGSGRLAVGALAGFPELASEVLAFMRQNATAINSAGTVATPEAAQATHDEQQVPSNAAGD